MLNSVTDDHITLASKPWVGLLYAQNYCHSMICLGAHNSKRLSSSHSLDVQNTCWTLYGISLREETQLPAPNAMMTPPGATSLRILYRW